MVQKILTFSILTEFYALPISRVREIIRYEKITPVHDADEYIVGVINLRGQVIPVLDLKLKLGLERDHYTDKNVFIITEIVGGNGKYYIGLAVDAVHNVLDIDDEQIQSTPQVGIRLKNKYVSGIIRLTDGNMAIMVDVDKIVNSEEVLMNIPQAIKK